MTNETHTYLAAAEVCGLGQTRNSVLLLLAWGRERAANVISVGLLSLSLSLFLGFAPVESDQLALGFTCIGIAPCPYPSLHSRGDLCVKVNERCR